MHTHQLPKAAVGYALSFFLRCVELLLELDAEPSVGGARRLLRELFLEEASISSGMSFHSMSALLF